MKIKQFYSLLVTIIFLMIIVPNLLANENKRNITDMRGKTVLIPKEIKKIATIDDGLIEGVLTHLGEIDKIVAISSWSLKMDYKYDFETIEGKSYSHKGLNTMKYLHPWLDDLPCFGARQGDMLNFETLAMVEPDLVILRVGDCTIASNQPDRLKQTIDTIEDLEIPLVVIYAPSFYKSGSLETLRNEIAVIGDVFNKQQQALLLADYLAQTEKIIRTRTADISAEEKPNLLYLGLNPDIRKEGGAGSIHGINTPESYIIEDIVNAKNAFRKNGSNLPVSGEHLYAIDPDVIILPTYNGYHPPSELYNAPYYVNLAELKAIKNKRVYALPWSPMNCSKRLEYPIDLLIVAKAAYPEKFQDFNVYEFALKFYQDVYGVNEEQAKGLRSTQLLDWMKENDF